MAVNGGGLKEENMRGLFDLPDDGLVSSLALTPDGCYAFAAFGGGEVRLYAHALRTVGASSRSGTIVAQIKSKVRRRICKFGRLGKGGEIRQRTQWGRDSRAARLVERGKTRVEYIEETEGWQALLVCGVRGESWCGTSLQIAHTLGQVLSVSKIGD